MISIWKQELVENTNAAFGVKSDADDFDEEHDALHRNSASLR